MSSGWCPSISLGKTSLSQLLVVSRLTSTFSPLIVLNFRSCRCLKQSIQPLEKRKSSMPEAVANFSAYLSKCEFTPATFSLWLVRTSTTQHCPGLHVSHHGSTSSKNQSSHPRLNSSASNNCPKSWQRCFWTILSLCRFQPKFPFPVSMHFTLASLSSKVIDFSLIQPFFSEHEVAKIVLTRS